MDDNIKTPSLEAKDEFTIIDGKEVKVVRTPEMKDEPEPTIHHHNNLDQPAIDLTREVTGTVLHNDLGGVTSDQHHTKLHAASHTSGGADDLTGITLTNMVYNGGTATSMKLVTPTIGTMASTGGTANTLTLGTPTITGGTYSLGTFGTPTIIGGTATSLNLVTPTIGTPSLTGGTVNPIAYSVGGTVGVDGTVVYIKTVDFGGTTTTSGTIVFRKGIATNVS